MSRHHSCHRPVVNLATTRHWFVLQLKTLYMIHGVRSSHVVLQNVAPGQVVDPLVGSNRGQAAVCPLCGEQLPSACIVENLCVSEAMKVKLPYACIVQRTSCPTCARGSCAPHVVQERPEHGNVRGLCDARRAVASGLRVVASLSSEASGLWFWRRERGRTISQWTPPEVQLFPVGGGRLWKRRKGRSRTEFSSWMMTFSSGILKSRCQQRVFLEKFPRKSSFSSSVEETAWASANVCGSSSWIA